MTRLCCYKNQNNLKKYIPVLASSFFSNLAALLSKKAIIIPQNRDRRQKRKPIEKDEVNKKLCVRKNWNC